MEGVHRHQRGDNESCARRRPHHPQRRNDLQVPVRRTAQEGHIDEEQQPTGRGEGRGASQARPNVDHHCPVRLLQLAVCRALHDLPGGPGVDEKFRDLPGRVQRLRAGKLCCQLLRVLPVQHGLQEGVLRHALFVFRGQVGRGTCSSSNRQRYVLYSFLCRREAPLYKLHIVFHAFLAFRELTFSPSLNFYLVSTAHKKSSIELDFCVH